MTGVSLNQYRITARLGAGGMGEVYRARDTRLNRDVAIKVLPKDFVGDGDRLRRFEQEARTLAALNHPNILTIHDAGVHDGAPYLVSELLEGKTLREEMNGGALPLRKATDYALQIAQGLAAAHGKGVIHRDLKPENVFVSRDGRVKILDFGLAKLRHPSPGLQPSSLLAGEKDGVMDEAATLRVDADALLNTTEPGAVMGTPAYMSPEQVRGEPADHRADIFAFGTVLYEMLSGTRAFRRNTPVESMHAVLKETPPDLATTHPNVPLPLSRVVERCLEKQPDNRFQSAQDLAFALTEVASPRAGTPLGRSVAPRPWKRATLVTSVVLLAGLAVWMLVKHGRDSSTATRAASNPPAPPLEANKSIAVLPFVNLSADKSDEYLSLRDGMAEELINALGGVPGLRVPGRSSSFAYKDLSEDNLFRKVGAQLNVSTVLEGSVRKAGGQLRIIARLVNVADGFQIWSETYDRPMTNILALQGEIATRVAQALKIRLGMEEARALTKAATGNPEAHRLYLLGRYHFGKVTGAGHTNAMHYFTQALQLDPSYALAYCGLADLYGWMGGGLLSGREAWAREKELAEKALALDPSLAEAHLSLGVALANAFDWKGGERAIRRALELNPRLELAWDQLAWIQSVFGRFEEAIRTEQRAVELDPLSLMFNSSLCGRLTWARRYDEAVAQARKTLELDPNFADAHFRWGWCFIWKGDPAGAIAPLQKVKLLDPQPFYDGALAYAYARSGDRAKAEQVVRDWDDRAKQRYVSPSLRMLFHLGLGEREKALDWLEKCYEEQDGFCSCWDLKVSPIYDPLRTEPRFLALLKKVFPE